MKVGAIIMNTYGISDRAILREIGRRLKRKRLEKNLSQQRLAELAGLNRTTIGEAERGTPFGVLTLVQILRALNALEAIDSFLPDPGISPLQLAKMKGKERRRASPQIAAHDEGESDW
jgi:transcriptional regulator with XRE-family HTH domain